MGAGAGATGDAVRECVGVAPAKRPSVCTSPTICACFPGPRFDCIVLFVCAFSTKNKNPCPALFCTPCSFCLFVPPPCKTTTPTTHVLLLRFCEKTKRGGDGEIHTVPRYQLGVGAIFTHTKEIKVVSTASHVRPTTALKLAGTPWLPWQANEQTTPKHHAF